MTERDQEEKHPYIFVNRRKFEEGDGVQPVMTEGQIAALIGVPSDNAVVRLETRDGLILITEPVQIKSGMQFLVTRQTVEGGHES